MSLHILSSSTKILHNILYRQCDSIVHNVTTHYHKLTRNPGIEKRRKLLATEPDESVEIEELEEVESDFMNVGEMYNEYEREMRKMKERNQHKIVGRKYFKPQREPKLLTWQEKEQIHYLHASNPEEWTVEKLASSFPASETIIMKILKSSWKPSDNQRIVQYNQGVANNWKLLRQGKLEISEELKAHVSKFSSRENMCLPTYEDAVKSPLVEAGKSPCNNQNISEFGNIIQSYEELKSRSNGEVENSLKKSQFQKIPPVPVDETFLLMSGNKRSKIRLHSTLDEYRKDILNSVESGKNIDQLDKVMLAAYRDKIATNYEGSEVAIENKFEDETVLENSEYVGKSKQINKPNLAFDANCPPERIKIPKYQKLKGNLYRVEDCYYDVDGEFLYRVPGMK